MRRRRRRSPWGRGWFRCKRVPKGACRSCMRQAVPVRVGVRVFVRARVSVWAGASAWACQMPC